MKKTAIRRLAITAALGLALLAFVVLSVRDSLNPFGPSPDAVGPGEIAGGVEARDRRRAPMSAAGDRSPSQNPAQGQGASVREEPSARRGDSPRPIVSGGPMTMDMWLQARNQGFDRETPAQLIENLANWDDMIDAMLSDSTYIQGGPNSEMRRLLRLRRVRRLLEIGAEDPALVTPLLRTTLMDVLEQWLPIVQEKMHPTKPARNQSEPDEWDKLTIRAIAATYLLGELKDYDALPLLNHAFLMQQGWVKTIERWGADQAPVPPAMSLYAMHRLIVQIPPDRILPQAAAARADYMIYAAQNIPDAIVFKKSAANSDGGITYRELPPGAPVEERPFTFHPPPPGPYRTDLVRYPVMLFRDGGEIQTESSLSQVLSDRAWDWHARMAAFIELNFP